MKILQKLKLRHNVGLIRSQQYVLLSNINTEYRGFMLTLEVVLIATVTLCFCASARYTDDGVLAMRLLIVGCIGATTLLAVFSSAADAFEGSEAMVMSWRRLPLQDAWMKRFLKSVKPAGIMVGSYFEADKGLVMTIARIIVDNTVSLIML